MSHIRVKVKNMTNLGRMGRAEKEATLVTIHLQTSSFHFDGSMKCKCFGYLGIHHLNVLMYLIYLL
jgi:hypothetical protein